MEPQAQLSQQHPPCRNAKPSKLMESTTEGAPVSPEAIRAAVVLGLGPRLSAIAEDLREEAHGNGDSRKTTETETHTSLATAYACTVCKRPIPGKIWMPTNQIRALPARTHVSRELCARALQTSQGI